MEIPLCHHCSQLISDAQNFVSCPILKIHECSFCFGILDDGGLRKEIAEAFKTSYEKLGYDGGTFILAVNVPTTMILREHIVGKLLCDEVSKETPKILYTDLLLRDIEKISGLRGSLNSDLVLTVTLENDEFVTRDVDFLLRNLPKEFTAHGKRKSGITADEMFSKVRVQNLGPSLTQEMAGKYRILSPSKRCTFSIGLNRESVYIAGRYCKFSRTLPQSPWIAGFDDDYSPGNSVSEKIAEKLKGYFCASDSRFISSGREDIDVRMLGNGRPFALNLINARKIASLRKNTVGQTMRILEYRINEDKDVQISHLCRVSAQEALVLNVGQEEKKKTYAAVCCSRVPVTLEMLHRLEKSAPVELTQKTVVRVLKRRALHDRKRDIYRIKALRLNTYHFLLRLETQAGTYVKEFVHGDFGRTTPSVGELMGLDSDFVDILQLDVENVDLEWPPQKGQ